MPAKITVRAELASLLAKSQELTDANRQSQLKKEADRREDQKRLKAKKANEDAARRKPLEDPVGRNIFTAAAGGGAPVALVFQNPLLQQFWTADQQSNITLNIPELGLPGGNTPTGDDSYTRGVFYDQDDGTGQVSGFARRLYQAVQDTFVLPLGRDKMILFRHGRIAAREYKWEITGGFGFGYLEFTIAYDVQDQAFYTQALFANRTYIKEIAVPPFMLARCLELCGEYQLFPSTQSDPNSQPDFPTPVLTDDWVNAIGYQDVSRELYNGKNTDFSAGIYEYILGTAPVARPRNKLRTCDIAGNCPRYAPDMGYIERITFETTSDLTSPSPVYRRYPSATIRLIDPVGNAVFTNRDFTGWDWNNPSYCYQQALACGFAPADLAPSPLPPP